MEMINLTELIADIEKRLTEVERFQQITYQQYQTIIKRQKPFTCPVCAGEGKKYFIPTNNLLQIYISFTIDAQGRYFNNCHACQGKGVLWN